MSKVYSSLKVLHPATFKNLHNYDTVILILHLQIVIDIDTTNHKKTNVMTDPVGQFMSGVSFKYTCTIISLPLSVSSVGLRLAYQTLTFEYVCD